MDIQGDRFEIIRRAREVFEELRGRGLDHYEILLELPKYTVRGPNGSPLPTATIDFRSELYVVALQEALDSDGAPLYTSEEQNVEYELGMIHIKRMATVPGRSSR